MLRQHPRPKTLQKWSEFVKPAVPRKNSPFPRRWGEAVTEKVELDHIRILKVCEIKSLWNFYTWGFVVKQTWRRPQISAPLTTRSFPETNCGSRILILKIRYSSRKKATSPLSKTISFHLLFRGEISWYYRNGNLLFDSISRQWISNHLSFSLVPRVAWGVYRG